MLPIILDFCKAFMYHLYINKRKKDIRYGQENII